jgi:hypothetical protein
VSQLQRDLSASPDSVGGIFREHCEQLHLLATCLFEPENVSVPSMRGPRERGFDLSGSPLPPLLDC